MTAPDGDYDLELAMSGWNGNLGVDLIANGQLRVAAYCPTHQVAPGSPDFTEVVRFPVHVARGTLDLTIANDAGAGTWWHPAPINTSRWALWGLRLLPATRPLPAPLPELAYGFAERDIAWLPQPWGLSEETTLDLARTCLHSRSPKGTFRAAVPAGQYELELVIGYTAARQQGQTPKMNVTLQGQQVLTDFVSPQSKEAKSLKFPEATEWRTVFPGCTRAPGSAQITAGGARPSHHPETLSERNADAAGGCRARRSSLGTVTVAVRVPPACGSPSGPQAPTSQVDRHSHCSRAPAVPVSKKAHPRDMAKHRGADGVTRVTHPVCPATIATEVRDRAHPPTHAPATVARRSGCRDRRPGARTDRRSHLHCPRH
jgi:hypothetical protein